MAARSRMGGRPYRSYMERVAAADPRADVEGARGRLHSVTWCDV